MLKIYNTLTRKKEEFKPLKNVVGLYTCGPTVYHYAHIGNLRAYVAEDILKRVLKYNNYRIKHVMNITDVGHLTSDADTGEDKLEKQAKKEKKDAKELAKFYTNSFIKDIHALNIIDPDHWCKATDHIKEQITWIKKLEKAGFTYTTQDGIYFNTAKFEDYGVFSKKNIEGLEAGKRIKTGDKKNKTDFALWKFSPKNETRQMEWKSPWGVGFPGWHLECSVMATKYLGTQFDIHCGGIDHIQVHHTNEIAQTESLTKKKWVNYWMHIEFVLFNNEKMSKSKGSTITLQELKKEGFDARTYRYFLLNTHYKKSINISKDGLKAAKEALIKLDNRFLAFTNESKGRTKNYEINFLKFINDDLNTPKALSVIWALLKDEKIGDEEKRNALLKFDKVLGLDLTNLKPTKTPKKISELMLQRETARQNKDFKLADELRQQILKQGYIIEDTKTKPKIKKVLTP